MSAQHGCPCSQCMTLMEYCDKVKSKLVAMERVGACMVQPTMVAEIAVANGHDAPTDADCREAQDYAVAVRFVAVELPSSSATISWIRKQVPEEPCSCG